MRAASDWAYIAIVALWLGLFTAAVGWLLGRLRDALRKPEPPELADDELWLLKHHIDPYHLAGGH